MQSKTITSFNFDHNIWQVHAHSQLPILLVETRNTEMRTVQFTALSMAKNEILWNELDLGDDWWRGLETMNEGVVVLHGFEDANNPIRVGVYVFDLYSGAKIYANDATTFYCLKQDILVEKLIMGEVETYFQINLADGTKSEITVDAITDTTVQHLLATPMFIEPTDDFFNKILRLILRYHGPEEVVCIEYLEHHKHICIAWIEKKEEQLQQHLSVIDSGGQLILHDTIAAPLKGIALGAFFVSQSYLVFVKDGSQLQYFSFS